MLKILNMIKREDPSIKIPPKIQFVDSCSANVSFKDKNTIHRKSKADFLLNMINYMTKLSPEMFVIMNQTDICLSIKEATKVNKKWEKCMLITYSET